jgi:cell division transport system permease protein
MITWLRQHFFAIADALGQMRHAPGNFCFNVVVLSMTLFLPFAGVTLLENLQTTTGRLDVEPEISLFLKTELSREEALAVEPHIQRIVKGQGEKARISFVSKEKALAALQKKEGVSNIVSTLGKNPLPDGYLIKLDAREGDLHFSAQVESIAQQLEKLPQIHRVQIDSAWIKRLAALVRIIRLCILFLGVTLGIVMVAVIFNTIRLQVLTRIDEITLIRTVGASRAYIRRPFYYTGVFHGLVAGALAMGMVFAALNLLNGALSELAYLYATEIRIAPPAPPVITLLLLSSAALGWIGALLSVNRHLGRIN